MQSEKEMLEEIGGEWLAARRVIEKFLIDLLGPSANEPAPGYPSGDVTLAQHNAAAIIARLASANRPMLIVFSDKYYVLEELQSTLEGE